MIHRQNRKEKAVRSARRSPDSPLRPSRYVECPAATDQHLQLVKLSGSLLVKSGESQRHDGCVANKKVKLSGGLYGRAVVGKKSQEEQAAPVAACSLP